MNIVSTIQIHAGGPGSGCNPAVGRCGRPRGTDNDVAPKVLNVVHMADTFHDALKQGGYKPETYKLSKGGTTLTQEPMGLVGALRLFSMAGVDRRLLENRQLQKVVTGKIFKETSGLDVSGQYMHNADALAIRDPEDSDSFVHELGHHFDNVWLQAARSYPGPQMDTDKVAELRGGMISEFTAARDDAAVSLGEKGGWTGGDKAFASKREKLYGIHLNAPRPYALSSEREWFATSFESYMAGDDGRRFLKKVAPQTYDLIDSLAHGKLFKNANN